MCSIIPGLIYTSDLTFPRTRSYVSRLVTALVTALETAAAAHDAVRNLRLAGRRYPVRTEGTISSRSGEANAPSFAAGGEKSLHDLCGGCRHYSPVAFP